MKRGMKSLLVLAFFSLLFGMLLIVGVSADTNFCLGGTPQVNNLYEFIYGSDPHLVWYKDNPSRINDNDTNTWQGALAESELAWQNSQCDWDRACFKYIYEAIVTFPKTADVINKVEYLRKGYIRNYRGYYEKTSLYYNNQWNQIYSRGLYYDTIAAQENISGGPWYNVNRVKVEISGYASNGGDHLYLNSQLYELRAWGSYCGDGTCDATENCSSCIADCGCGTGKICQNGVCLINKPCSSPNDIIIKLYQSNNSHGALWNYPDYYYDICCSDIFGVGAAECNGVHTCSGTNKILGLYQENNSHAEIPSLDNYIYDVCYGDLVCEADLSVGDSCTNGGEVVVRLSQNTNSHISDASDTNYPIKVCCRSVISPPSIGNVYWANMLDKKINETDLNDLVKLVVEGSDMSGKNVEYEIYKSVKWWFDSKVAQSSGGFITWRAGLRDDGSLEAGQYYFRARIEGGAWISTENNADVNYRYLTVSATENNFPPVVNIVGPELGDIFYIGEQINFTQTSYDEDDEINFLWDLGDGSTSSEPGLIHSYTDKDQKTIKLTATDERGSVVIDRTSILIINPSGTKYVFAHIDKPEWGESISGMIISFNASSSYAVETTSCDGTSCTINCLGGACHLLTHVGGQNIQDPNGTRGNYDDLNFSWTFDDNVTYRAKGMLGVWFNKVFGTIGNHWAKLITSINPEGSSETQFSNYVNSMCGYITDLSGVAKKVWWDEFGIPLDPRTEPGACLGKDLTTADPNCCPYGYDCVIPEGGEILTALCKLDGSYCAKIVGCGSYLTKEECLNDSEICQIALSQPGSTCGGTTYGGYDICGSDYLTSREDECECLWNDTTKRCYLKEDLWSTIYQDNRINYGCDEISGYYGECIDSLMGYKIDRELIYKSGTLPPTADIEQCEQKECKDYDGTIMCGQPLIKLLFFSLKNLIIAIIIIIIIYVIWIKKRSKGKIEVRKKKKL